MGADFSAPFLFSKSLPMRLLSYTIYRNDPEPKNGITFAPASSLSLEKLQKLIALLQDAANVMKHPAEYGIFGTDSVTTIV